MDEHGNAIWCARIKECACDQDLLKEPTMTILNSYVCASAHPCDSSAPWKVCQRYARMGAILSSLWSGIGCG
jgi:hypothetical protein